MIDVRWNKVSKAGGYEIRIKQCYNGNWTDWTYRRTSANHVKIYGWDGARKLATVVYHGEVSPHKQKYNYKDNYVLDALSTGCSYKVQVRAYKVVKGKYYYGPWSNTKPRINFPERHTRLLIKRKPDHRNIFYGHIGW